MDLVWRFGGIRPGKQILDADLRRWAGAGAAVDARAETASKPMAVGGRSNRVSDLPAEPASGTSSIIFRSWSCRPIFARVAGTFRWGRARSFVQEILLMHPLTLPIWLGGLWFFFVYRRTGKRFRSIGWAWIFTAAVIVDSEPTSVLLISRVSSAVRGRRRAVGAVAGAAETGVAQVRVSCPDAR